MVIYKNKSMLELEKVTLKDGTVYELNEKITKINYTDSGLLYIKIGEEKTYIKSSELTMVAKDKYKIEKCKHCGEGLDTGEYGPKEICPDCGKNFKI